MRDGKKLTQIREAFINTIVEEGFSGTSMSKIAKRAGVSPATIYIYFDSKEDMINKVYLQLKLDISKQIVEGVNPDSREYEKTFKAMWRRTYHYLLQNPNSFCFFEQFENSPYIDRLSDQQIEEIGFKVPHTLVNRAIEEGVIKDIPLEILRSFIIGPISRVVRMKIKGVIDVDEKLLNRSLDMIWDSLRVI
jgi:AcrR family transcriptional regulator